MVCRCFNDTSPIHNVTLFVFSWYWNTAQMLTLVKRLKNNSHVTSFWTEPHHCFSPHLLQLIRHTSSRNHRLPLIPALILKPHPRLDKVQISCWAGGWCMMGVVGEAERQREACVHEDEAVASHDFTAWVLFPCSLVEGFGLVSKVLWFCHKIIQLLTTL